MIDDFADPRNAHPVSRKLKAGKIKVSLQEWSLFSRQVGVLVKAGVPLVDAIKTLAEGEAASSRLSRLAEYLAAGIAEGTSLPLLLEAAALPNRFLAARIVQAAETTGKLETALFRIAEYSERRLQFRTQLLTLLAYPALTLSVASATIVFLFLFVIPRLVGVFQETHATLPLPTRLLINLGDVAGSVILGSSVVLLCAFPVYLVIRKRDAVAILAAKSVLALPVLGTLVRQSNLVRYTVTASDLLQAGIPILEALKLARATLTNIVLIGELARPEQAILRGDKLSSAFSDSRLFSPIIRRIISASEEAGRLDQGFAEAAAAIQAEFEVRTRLLVALIEPVIILAMSILVGFIAIAILLPIFEVSGLIL